MVGQPVITWNFCDRGRPLQDCFVGLLSQWSNTGSFTVHPNTFVSLDQEAMCVSVPGSEHASLKPGLSFGPFNRNSARRCKNVVVGLQRVSIKSPGAVHPHLQAHTMLAMRLKDLLPQVGAANIRGGLQRVVVWLWYMRF